jgi:hypothetical protein
LGQQPADLQQTATPLSACITDVDNRSSHKVERVKEAIEAIGATLTYLPSITLYHASNEINKFYFLIPPFHTLYICNAAPGCSLLAVVLEH